MLDPLTRHLPELHSSEFGHWNEQPKDADGTPEHPYVMPYVVYSDEVFGLQEDIGGFVEAHPEFDLHNYSKILEDHGLEWGADPMSRADVSGQDAQLVLALLVGAWRAERFCDGTFLAFLKNGSIERWLRRLEEIDRGR